MNEESALASKTTPKPFDPPTLRAMKADLDGFATPVRPGPSFGVRVAVYSIDLPFSFDGLVQPYTGGMTVALDKATNLPKPRLPKSLGGEGRDPVFESHPRYLQSGLALRVDRYPHACLEPAQVCRLEHFEADLSSTRPHWKKLHD